MAIEIFELCNEPGTYVNVNDGGAPIVTGETYSIIDGLSGAIYCATFVSGSSMPGPTYTLGTLFDSCFSCNSSIPFSAGTEYEGCIICCPCSTGATVNEVSVPHPVWTGIYGNSVTQLNAVQLGGQNGLNN